MQILYELSHQGSPNFECHNDREKHILEKKMHLCYGSKLNKSVSIARSLRRLCYEATILVLAAISFSFGNCSTHGVAS